MSRFEVPDLGTHLQGKVIVLTGMFSCPKCTIFFMGKKELTTDLVAILACLFESLHNWPQILLSTGGALGIGSELVRLLHSHGAHVFFGDVLISQGEALAAELSAASGASAQQPNQQQIKFLYTNVQDHLANLGLFDLALNTCGRVDHAVSVAGINREENIVDKELTLESVRKV
jgi:NADPH:quinone reductase-like Zn-dependent oxidoreductase